MVTIVNSVKDWNDLYRSKDYCNARVGFVPTMGALHEGHASLIKKSTAENDITIASIFLNPTQFNDPDDLKNYPVTFEEDLALLNSLDADYLFLPSYDEIYIDKFNYKVIEESLSKILCGASRPGHFTGVLTVVLKLINIIKPNTAYFGQKDYQQYLLIKGMCEAFFMNVKIVPCPTVREESGLALSSRNKLLTPEEKIIAPQFNKILKSPGKVDEIINGLEKTGFKVDYIEETAGRRFGAVYLGKVRLIDNVEI